jgi:peroxiredoxin
MSMNQEAAEYKAKVQERLGEKFGILAGDMERVRAAGTIDAALKVGELAPEFTLPDAFGKPVSFSALLAHGPVVISFYRGEWCPFCNIEMRALQQALPTMEQSGATLIAISPEKPDHGIVAAEKNKLTFPVLSDFGNQVARQFGIVFQIGQEHRRSSPRTSSRTTSHSVTARTHMNFQFRQLMLSIRSASFASHMSTWTI